jgi:hypothetical protein
VAVPIPHCSKVLLHWVTTPVVVEVAKAQACMRCGACPTVGWSERLILAARARWA